MSGADQPTVHRMIAARFRDQRTLKVIVFPNCLIRVCHESFYTIRDALNYHGQHAVFSPTLAAMEFAAGLVKLKRL